MSNEVEPPGGDAEPPASVVAKQKRRADLGSYGNNPLLAACAMAVVGALMAGAGVAVAVTSGAASKVELGGDPSVPGSVSVSPSAHASASMTQRPSGPASGPGSVPSASPSASANQLEACEVYVIGPSDTLSEISQRTGVPLDTLVKINDIEDPNWIYDDASLLIPRSGQQICP